jgi:hypothetical protein
MLKPNPTPFLDLIYRPVEPFEDLSYPLEFQSLYPFDDYVSLFF